MYFWQTYYNTKIILYVIFFEKVVKWCIAYKDEYIFESENGNHLYGGFLDVYDEYKDQLLLKMERRKLDAILHIEEREKIRRNRDDEGRSD